MNSSDYLQLTPPTFHGRSREIEQIIGTATCLPSSQSRVILVEGPGGIGKSMLLRQAAQVLRDEHPGISCVGPLDLDDTGYRVVTNTGFAIANALGSTHFTQYIEANRKYQGKELDTLDRATILIHLAMSDKYFITDYQQFAQNRRIVIFADTIEAIRDTHTWSYLVRMIALLPNTLLVLAGRPESYRGTSSIPFSAESRQFQRMPYIRHYKD